MDSYRASLQSVEDSAAKKLVTAIFDTNETINKANFVSKIASNEEMSKAMSCHGLRSYLVKIVKSAPPEAVSRTNGN
jgi:hypothetical protein